MKMMYWATTLTSLWKMVEKVIWTGGGWLKKVIEEVDYLDPLQVRVGDKTQTALVAFLDNL